METYETHTKGLRQIVHNDRVLAHAILDVSGFYYVEFIGKGWFEPYTLRQIADLVDELNSDFEKSLKEYFESQKP